MEALTFFYIGRRRLIDVLTEQRLAPSSLLLENVLRHASCTCSALCGVITFIGRRMPCATLLHIMVTVSDLLCHI